MIFDWTSRPPRSTRSGNRQTPEWEEKREERGGWYEDGEGRGVEGLDHFAGNLP